MSYFLNWDLLFDSCAEAVNVDLCFLVHVIFLVSVEFVHFICSGKFSAISYLNASPAFSPSPLRGTLSFVIQPCS